MKKGKTGERQRDWKEGQTAERFPVCINSYLKIQI